MKRQKKGGAKVSVIVLTFNSVSKLGGFLIEFLQVYLISNTIMLILFSLIITRRITPLIT